MKKTFANDMQDAREHLLAAASVLERSILKTNSVVVVLLNQTVLQLRHMARMTEGWERRHVEVKATPHE